MYDLKAGGAVDEGKAAKAEGAQPGKQTLAQGGEGPVATDAKHEKKKKAGFWHEVVEELRDEAKDKAKEQLEKIGDKIAEYPAKKIEELIDKLNDKAADTVKDGLRDLDHPTSCTQVDVDNLVAAVNTQRLVAGWKLLTGLEEASQAELKVIDDKKESGLKKGWETFQNFSKVLGSLGDFVDAMSHCNDLIKRIHTGAAKCRLRVNPKLQVLTLPKATALPKTLVLPPDIHTGGSLELHVPQPLVGVKDGLVLVG